MLNISVNLETGVASLARATSIKAGGGVPVRVTFSANPGDAPALELALSPDSSSASVLAYLDEFTAENSTTFLGLLDANDTRLIDHLEGKDQQTLLIELVVTTADAPRRPFPNVSVTVQAPKIVGPATSEGGPVYLTQTQSDARYMRGNLFRVSIPPLTETVTVDISSLELESNPTFLLATVACRGAAIFAAVDTLAGVTPTAVPLVLSARPPAGGATVTLFVAP